MTARPETLTFLVVGCQRCGTTWIDAALREHPQIYLPAQKQTYFFERHYDRGIEWYLRQFDGANTQHRAVGEVATGYCLTGVVARMAKHLPHVKLIMAMRHPVERAYSNFLTRRVESGWRSFEQAIEQDPDLLERGQYIEQIERLEKHYDRSRMHFLIYDDLLANDRAYLESILSFLGVDHDFDSSMIGQRMNAARFARLRAGLHRVGLKPALNALSRSAVGARIRRLTRARGRSSAETMDPETRARLVEHFASSNERLAAYLGRDLSAWTE
ncbi:MAG: sulfotransferase [Phycisphaerales bacterium]|nr:sulfotransferase [Phycisphaerae bacterium]NNF45041.1 sulfotransferase [Phycisphaerales bacterium]NNM27111.1 sulfotransferase [Phycisphaerales bacterium]